MSNVKNNEFSPDVQSHQQSQNFKTAFDQKLISLLIQQQKIHDFIHWLFQTSNEQIAILDKNSKFLTLNEPYSKIIGYKNAEEVIGLSYNSFRSKASDKAEVFKNQDKEVMTHQKPVEFLSYHQYSDSKWHLLYGEKSCLLDHNNQPVGVFSKAKDVTQHGLIDISRFLINDNLYYFGKLKKEAFTYYIYREHDDFGLTRCEKECLFFYIRGKTSQDIAKILHRSKRTIDMHLESIKFKLCVESKPQLIEKAITYGYMSMLPDSLFTKLKF